MRFFFPAALAALSLIFISCARKAEGLRAYDETVVSYKTAKTNLKPFSGPRRGTWETPAGWVEEGGSTLRLASFLVRRGSQTLECSIVKLSGEAGSVEANLRRWLGQCKVTPSYSELEGYVGAIKPESVGGMTMFVFDLTTFTRDPERNSILASALRQGEDTYFFKLTGKGDDLAQEKAAFLSLCRSFRPGEF